MCDENEYRRNYQRETYAWRKEHGVCVKCGYEDALPGKTKCQDCADKYAKYSKECYEKHKEERRARQRIYDRAHYQYKRKLVVE